MEGTANYIGGGTLIITVDKFNGSGSHNSWNFAVSGEVGQTGATGASGVISVTSPITNSGSSSSAVIGINQSLLSLTRSQISDFTSGTVAVSGTAVYATTSGTAVTISGSITNSQISDFASGTVANISGTVTQAQVTSLVTDLSAKASLGSANTFSVGGHVITNAATAVVPLAIRQIAGQSADLLQFQDTNGTVIGRFNNSAQAGFSRVTAGQATISGVARLFATSTGTAEIPLAVRGVASQSANLQEWQDSAGGTVAYVDKNGSGRFTNSVGISAIPFAYNAMLSVSTQGTANSGVTIRGVAGQSADLQQWQNSGGTAIATLSSAGAFRATQTSTITDYATMREANSGGYLRLTKSTAALTNPGAGLAAIYFRDGTITGLKLVVRAGATGAETTILDNIPV